MRKQAAEQDVRIRANDATLALLRQQARSVVNDDMLENMELGTVISTPLVVVLIAAMVYGVYIVFGLPEDDRPTFEWFGKSEPWAPPTRTSPRRQELKPNTYFGM